MKKLISILLCLCLMLISVNVMALNSTEAVTNIIDSHDIIETPIDNGGITITHTPGSPEEQAIQKILAHKKALGQEIPDESRGVTKDLVDGAVYYIKNYFSGKYLNVHYGVNANGTNVYQWTGDSSTEQKFKIVKDNTNNCYKIYAMCSSNGTNRVLDVVRNGAPLASGQNVDIWTPVDHTAQRLILTPLLLDDLFHIQMLGNDDLYFTTIDKSNGTSGGTKPTSAGNVFIQTFDINDNQQWQFIPVNDSTQTSPSISASINGSNPYYKVSYTLSAGSAWYGKLTVPGNYYCSAFTSGSTDTYMELYSDAAFTDLIVSNDDSGHGTNALLHFYIASGTSYYIKVRGYSNTTSGSFDIIIHRGLPTSKSEKSDMFSIFNSSTYMGYNTCYTYALGYYINPVTGNKYKNYEAVPGGIDGNYINKSSLKDVPTFKAAVETALTRDCIAFGGDFKQISNTTQPRQGYYKVALVLAPGYDYHWYRQLPNGQWAHKVGTTTASNMDFSGKVIYDPSTCDRDNSKNGGRNYTEFIGWYEIKTPATTTATANTVHIDETVEESYPTHTNLTMKDVNKLHVGMPFEEVVEILGAPHRYVGSGFVAEVYKLADGSEISIYYVGGVIDCVCTEPKSGVPEVIIG